MKIREENSLVKKLRTGWWPLGGGIPGMAVCATLRNKPHGPEHQGLAGVLKFFTHGDKLDDDTPC